MSGHREMVVATARDLVASLKEAGEHRAAQIVIDLVHTYEQSRRTNSILNTELCELRAQLAARAAKREARVG